MRSICHQLGHIMQSYCHTNKYSPVNDVPMLSRSVIDRIKIYFKLFYIPPYSISSHPLHNTHAHKHTQTQAHIYMCVCVCVCVCVYQ